MFQYLGFNSTEFGLICGMTSLATCGLNDNSVEKNLQHDRKSVGRRCKALLDYCRCQDFENDCGSVTRKIFFVDENITPENLAVIFLMNKT